MAKLLNNGPQYPELSYNDLVTETARLIAELRSAEQRYLELKEELDHREKELFRALRARHLLESAHFCHICGEDDRKCGHPEESAQFAAEQNECGCDSCHPVH